MVHVKICGVTTPEDAIACADAGASAIGINFVASSPRRVDEARAITIVRALGERVLTVGVVAGGTADELRGLRDRVGLGCLQLHGDETPDVLAALLPHAYKALRVATAADVARADEFPGEHLLVDAKVEVALGGSGHAE